MRFRPLSATTFGTFLVLGAASLPAAPIVVNPVEVQPICDVSVDATDPVTWSLAPRSILGGDDGEADLRLRCGNYGVFDLSVDDIAPMSREAVIAPACTAISCGSERPRLYPSTPGEQSAARSAAWIPCNSAGCFAAVGLAGYTPGRPWIAVLDWDTIHGWSVGWTILGIANQAAPQSPAYEAVLLPLDEARLIPFARTGSTDVHVLTQLCTILEEIEIGGIAPPAVINMSFGRRLRDDDPRAAGGCDPRMLACQVARVLDRIVGPPTTEEPRTVLVASAGNDREPLFPAGLSSVLPAGSLQLGQFEKLRRSELSWETPSYAPRAQALMPGYGLCLGEKLGADSTHEWAAPPGTSYAAAVFSGWLAETLARSDVRQPLGSQPWFPARNCNPSHSTCTHVLTHGALSYASNPRVDGLFRRAFDPSRPCGASAPIEADEVLALVTQPASAAALPSETFLDVFADFELPAPPSSPCVPCQGMSSINGLAAGGGTKASPAAFYLDLSGITQLVPPFPPELALQTDITELYLRIGDLAFLRLMPTAGQLNDFSALEGGSVRRLALSGVPDLVWGTAQPSLIFVLRPTQEPLTERRFWISIPILLGN